MHKIKMKLERIKRGKRAADLDRAYLESEAVKEEIRKFVFDEFVKKDPDEISF